MYNAPSVAPSYLIGVTDCFPEGLYNLPLTWITINGVFFVSFLNAERWIFGISLYGT